ncbi:PALB2 protein, partial [Bucco capensis]|nr:PALB2 protein [Bucco capensis]
AEDEVLPADGNSTVTGESKSPRGEHSDSHPFPTDPALGNVEELLENQQLEAEPGLSQAEKEAAAGSGLGSCTVVEGLLFPLEYYIRTTRRMASCQSKGNLGAVILSQLGRSKKGQRSKQKDANPDQPSPGSAENDLESGVRLFPSPGADPAHPSSPQSSLPASSGSSTSLGSASQSSITSAQRAQRPAQGRLKGRRRSSCKASAQQLSQELTEGLAFLTPGESSSLLSSEAHKESCEAKLDKAPSGESRRGGGSYPAGSEAAAALGLPAVGSDTCGSLSFPSPQGLLPMLAITEFHLPDEEFGPLKLEKLESSPLKDLEAFVPSVLADGVASEDAHRVTAEEQPLQTHLLSPFKHEMPGLPPGERPAARKELSSHELLFTPLGTVLAASPTQPGSQIASSLFPVVGASPAVLPPAPSQPLPRTPPAAPASLQPCRGAPAPASAFPLHWSSCAAAPAGKEEEQGPGFALEAERGPSPASGEAVALEKQQQSGSEEQRSSPAQVTSCPLCQGHQAAEQLPAGLREESLQLVSELKDSCSSCAVDVSTVWWEAAGCRELCVVTACESSVSLWKPLPSDCWSKVHTWQLAEIPVIQILPLPDTCNLVCIALGELEIAEIRLLLCSPETDSFRQSLVRSGTIKAALGLRGRRLVSSSRPGQEQQVEVVSLSETGRSKDGHTLLPPEETVVAFAEVEGMRDALVGTTALNSLVIWNVQTGQLLRKMHVGYSYPAPICHRAYSDSGLLFVAVSHPHGEESECSGSPAFHLLAFNPSTARGKGVASSSLPAGHTGRQYLEGDVKDTLAAAVLSSGTIAVWDLLLGHCTALLPPGPAGSWALTRWASSSSTSTCLLAGQRDGTVCLYRY